MELGGYECDLCHDEQARMRYVKVYDPEGGEFWQGFMCDECFKTIEERWPSNDGISDVWAPVEDDRE